jgi:hypothetical protein
LFGKIKSALIPEEIDLLEAVTEFLNGTSDAKLQYAFSKLE